MTSSTIIPPRLAANRQRDTLYPETDGQPIGETGIHVVAIPHLFWTLRQFFSRNDETYVASDLFVYYEEGEPTARVAPDVMVVKGVPKHMRRSFKLWEEPARPEVVFEISSKSTWLDDLGNKQLIYSLMGVKEYFLFDPEGAYLSPQFQGFRLSEHEAQPIAPDDDGSLVSDLLKLRFTVDGHLLRATDLTTGAILPGPDTIYDLAAEANERAEAAEAEIERLRALLAQRESEDA